MSSAYLSLFMFLLAILIPACASSSPAFHMMYSAYKLNKQGDNIQPWCTPFLIWNLSVIPCPILNVASWPAYRFLRRQVRWSSIPISWRIFQFVVIHTVKGFAIVNKTEIDVFLELSCFFDDSVVKVKSLSHVQLFATPWTGAHQALLSMGFFRQEYWSGLPFPSPGDLPYPGIEPRYPALQ